MKEKKVIESWGQLNVAQYEELLKIQQEHPNDSTKYIIEYLYDIHDADLIPIGEYAVYIAGLRKFVGTPIDNARLSPSASYTVNGRSYRVDITPSAFSVAQYTDLTNYIKQQGSLTDLLSVVVIPEGKDYNEGYDMVQARSDIGMLPLEAGFAVIGFFGRWSKASIRTFLRFLTRRMKDRNGKVPKETIEKLEREVETLCRLMASFPTC